MARMRYLKPEFWTDAKMVRLSPYARLLYMGMWNFALCDHGHLPDDPEQLKLNILAFDDVDVDALLNELCDAGRVVRIATSDGRAFLHIPKLDQHQKTETRWSPRCAACSPNLPKPLPTTPVHPEPPQASAGRGGEGRDREKNSSSTAARPTAPDPDFAKFWAAYPRKVGKGAAAKAWTKAIRDGADPPDVIAGAERYRDDPRRRREDPKYTAHPATWLNAQRWLDQADDPVPVGIRPFWDN